MISHFADSGDAGDTGDKLLKQYEQETRLPIISHHPEESKEFE